MADKKDSRPSIFEKMMDVGHAVLDSQFQKARADILNSDIEDNFHYSKAVTEDPSYAINAAGWKEKPHRLQDGHLKQMSIKNSVISAIIQTRQNQISNFSKLVNSEKERGWMLCLRDEEELLEKIKEELMGEMQKEEAQEGQELQEPQEDQEVVEKAEDPDADPEVDGDEGEAARASDADNMSDDDVEEYNWELERKAKEKLEAKYKKDKSKVQDILIHCGSAENRPFESRKWNLDTFFRAIVRDSLTYDRYAVELVPDNAKRLHHFFPVDASTIKFSSNRLSDYKEVAENFNNLDILYPERQAQAMQKQKVLDLDESLLEKDAYKYVQVIRGKIERAYTTDELKLGIRNPTTDIYNNGYGISELELVVSLVTGHLNAEFYNQAYFTQGFSAKGILHIQAAINRRKLETVRQQWQHMLRGARNSFQTPIFAGLDKVEWIPLTQNHNDIGFEGWMRYLIKMICAIYQIDPQEIGIGLKEEGGAGGLSGDNTQQKIDQSKDKGLYPLLRHIENFMNEEILPYIDNRFVLKFTGIDDESPVETVERLERLGKFAMTANEIREELGLPPLPGMDEVILGPDYLTWYSQFSESAQKNQQAMMEAQGEMDQGKDGEEEDPTMNFGEDSFYNNMDEGLNGPNEETQKSLKKKGRLLKAEYYKVD